MGVDSPGRRGVEAGAAGEDEVPPVDGPEVDSRGRKSSASPIRCSVASTTSLGSRGCGDDVRRPAGEHRDRDVGAGEAVGDLVQGPVAAEGDDDVVTALAGLAADLDRVVRRLGRHCLDLVAGLKRVDDQVLEPVGHRGRVGVDDDQHPLLGRRSADPAPFSDGSVRGSIDRDGVGWHCRAFLRRHVTQPPRSGPAPPRDLADQPLRPSADRRGRPPPRGSGTPGSPRRCPTAPGQSHRRCAVARRSGPDLLRSALVEREALVDQRAMVDYRLAVPGQQDLAPAAPWSSAATRGRSSSARGRSFGAVERAGDQRVRGDVGDQVVGAEQDSPLGVPEQGVGGTVAGRC